MRPGGEKRGSAKDRRERKLWLLRTFGDGSRCKCVHCGKPLDYITVEADRIIPGESYRHENIQPSCRHDNAARSDNINWVSPLAKASA